MDVLFVVFARLSQTTVPPLFFILHVVDACVSGAPTAENAEVVRVGVLDTLLSGYTGTDTVGLAIYADVVENDYISPAAKISGFLGSVANARTS